MTTPSESAQAAEGALEPQAQGAEGSGEAESGTEWVRAEGEGKGTLPSGDLEGAEEGEAFYSASDVPDGLRATYREMKKGLTQKFQGVSARAKALEAREQGLSEAQHKAQLFDGLMSEPRVVSYIRSLEGTPVGPDVEDPEVDPAARNWMEKQLGPLKNELQSLQRVTAHFKEREEFTRENPDWEDYQEGMEEYVSLHRSRGVQKPLQDAYNAAKRAALEKRLSSFTKKGKAAAASVEASGSPAASARKHPKKMAFEEARQAALSDLGLPKSVWG